MRSPIPTRLSAFTLLLAATLHAQSRTPTSPAQSSQTPAPSTIPATGPTNTPTLTLPPAQSPPRRATVSFTNGQLTVSASNSSLNQILREISRLTGIKITGGVAEERVFGEYGPAAPAEVLGTLLDGTGSNIFFTASEGDKPAELILTPRTGGVTPPNPNAARFDNTSDDDGSRAATPPAPQPVESQSQPARPNPVAAPIQPPQVNGNADSAPQQPAAQPADSTNQQSPNGVKTPQQIYDELMRLRRQQQSQPQ
jgi:hypothetical protein